MMSKFRNTHMGETAVVIGNGPSLKDVPNTWLDKYPTFGSNRIFLKYIPRYYVAVNPLVIAQNKASIEMMECVKFLRPGIVDSGYPLNSQPKKEFSYEPHKWIYEGYTVTFVSLQLAFFMGFSTVLLVGVDHRYKFDGKPNQESVMSSDDPNHFDPEYFKGQRWNNPDLFQSEVAYGLALVAYTKAGRRIINLTPGSDLNVFECGSIHEW